MESRGDSMGDWKPALIPGIDLRGLPLTPEEGFVASRLDGLTDLHGISVGTGLSAERVAAALDRLVSLGAGPPPPGSREEGAPPEGHQAGGPGGAPPQPYRN